MKILMIFLLFVSIASAQTAAEYFERADKAFAVKDYASNVSLLEKTIEAGGDHPRILYFLARGYALIGKPDEACSWLKKIADLGIVYNPREDPNFTTIHPLPQFKSIEEQFALNLKPTNFSKTFLTFDNNKIIPEGVAYDAARKQFYFGDVAGNRIVTYQEGKLEDFSKPEDGLWSVLGMKIDAQRRMLWVASSGLQGEHNGKSGIFQYDLNTRQLIGKFLLPGTGHGLGDVEIDSRGNVYATDSNTPTVYVLKQGSKSLEVLVGGDAFRSPQGLALSKDEKTLFIADYSRGLFALELASGKLRKLARSPGTTTVAGMDGLYFYKDSLIGIQNGFDPKRVLRIYLSRDSQTIERVDVLESNHSAFPEPTLGVIVQDELYYVGNSMIGPYLDDPKTELKPGIILKLAL